MKLLSFLNPWRLVIAVQCNAIQFLIGKCKKNKLQIAQAKSVPLMDNLLTNCQSLTPHLQAFRSEFPQFVGSARLVLPTSIIHVQRKIIPAIYSPKEIREHLQVHLKRTMPGTQEKLVLDYKVLEAVNDHEQQVAYVAMRANFLQSMQSTFAAVGIKLKVIEADVYALLRLVKTYLPDAFNTDIHCLLSITQRRSLCIYFRNADILFHQESTFDLKQLHRTQQIFLNQQKVMVEKLFIFAPEITNEEITALTEIYQTSPIIWNNQHSILSENPLPADYYSALGAMLRK